MNKRKIFKFLTSFLIFGLTCFFLVSCDNFFKTEEQLDMEERQQELYQLYKEAKGNEALSYDEWLLSITGKDGVGIKNIELTSSVGNVDTYTITLTDNTTYTFTVENYRNDYSSISAISLPDGCLFINQYEIVKADLSYVGKNFDENLLKWSSSSEAVVVSNGALIAVEPGYAEITATYGELVATSNSGVFVKKSKNYFTSTDTNLIYTYAVTGFYDGDTPVERDGHVLANENISAVPYVIY